MSEYKTHPGTLYDYTAGVYCGVLVTEKVMRKLAALQAQHLESVKRLLADEAERGSVHPSMWTLHRPDGVQTTVKFIHTSADLRERIKNATTTHQPTAHPLVFIAGSMDEAKQMADARHAALGGEFADSEGGAA
jgi:hypothetical protein